MLVLRRGPGQSILLGESGNIKFKILTNDGEQVRIGIDAPQDVTILREELFLRENPQARTVNASYKECAVSCQS